IHFRGETGDYLQPAPGEPQTNLLKMARAGLLSELRATIAQAKRGMTTATATDVEVEAGEHGSKRICDIEVVPFTGLPEANERLETAKEELQSTNEELTTVNEELHSRNQEVNLINSDLVNLLSTVDVPVLILDIDRRIRRFTPKARSILNVLPSDVGRALDD